MKHRTSSRLIALFALTLSSIFTGGVAKQSSPFVGHWEAVDADGGDVRLTIGGPPRGPFRITWTEGYLGYCNGEAGIARGTGTVNPDSPNILEGALLLKCLTGANKPLQMEPVWHYDPATDTLTAHGGEGETDTVWHRPGHPPPPPSWIVIARPADDGVDGGHFPVGTVVSLLVLDDNHNQRWYGTAKASYPDWDPENTWVQYDLSGEDGVDLMAGDHVWMYDGINAKELVVSALEVTAVDLVSYTVSGSAAPRSVVFVDLPDGPLMVVADQDGNWEMPFDDSAMGQWWAAYQPDKDEDQTRVPFFVPNPHFSVFPEWEYIEGWEWPEGATVNVTVAAKPLCNASGTSGHPDWDPQELFVGIDLPAGCDIEAADDVTLSDGRTTRTHTVRNLAITEVDELVGIVRGTADAWAQVYVWPHGFDEVLSTADGDGKWSAAVSTDLVGGMCGRSEIRDENGNATAVDWCPRRFSVFPEWEYIEGWDWPEGATVSARVEGKPECDAQGISGTPEWNPRAMFVGIDLPDACDVEAGDVVALTESVTPPRSHKVENLSVTDVDELANTVTGSADPGAVIHVWPHGYDEVVADADGEGIWTADFTTDLVEGMCGRSEIRDANGNATAVDWCVPIFRLIAFPDANEVFGYGWPEGSSVSLTIKGEFVQEATVGPAPWDEADILAYFSLGGVHDLVPGDTVNLTGSGHTEEYIVRELSVTDVNAQTDTVAGTAEPGAELHLRVHGYEGSDVETITGGDGTWLAEFTIDLMGGMCGRAEIQDDGNATAWDWCLPAMGLRVNYGDDWVESFYEPGHRVDLTVKEDDGATVKATATAYTEPKDFWGGQTGFQTAPEDWSDGQPDIQPGDWVYATVDNGVTAEVQIGRIQGVVDIESDSITGTIEAPLEDPVQVECLDWGSGQDPPAANKDGGTILTDGLDTYICSWDPASEWDIQAWQNVGVGYITPDGHWVARGFHAEQWVAGYLYDMDAGS